MALLIYIIASHAFFPTIKMQQPTDKTDVTFYCLKCRDRRTVSAELHKIKHKRIHKSRCPVCGGGLAKATGKDPLYGRKLTVKEIWQRQCARRSAARKQKVADAVDNLPVYKVELIDKEPQ